MPPCFCATVLKVYKIGLAVMVAAIGKPVRSTGGLLPIAGRSCVIQRSPLLYKKFAFYLCTGRGTSIIGIQEGTLVTDFY